jgi:hypothetical protein
MILFKFLALSYNIIFNSRPRLVIFPIAASCWPPSDNICMMKQENVKGERQPGGWPKNCSNVARRSCYPRRRSSRSSASLIIHLRKRPNISALWKSHQVSPPCWCFLLNSNEIWGLRRALPITLPIELILICRMPRLRKPAFSVPGAARQKWLH